MSSPLLRETIERILAGTAIKEACKNIAAKKPIRNQKRPPLTADRQLFLSYGASVKKASQLAWKSDRVNHYAPHDIRMILHNWRLDRTNDHLPIIPTKEQFDLLNEFIANHFHRFPLRAGPGRCRAARFPHDHESAAIMTLALHILGWWFLASCTLGPFLTWVVFRRRRQAEVAFNTCMLIRLTHTNAETH